MSKLITRNEGKGICWQSKEEDLLDSYDILEENYSYILESMKDEMFLLENPKCNLFMELLFEKQVVGFVSYDTENGVGDI